MKMNRFSDEERQRLALLISEAQSRGLKINEDILAKKEYVFPTDPFGYFVKADGTLYNPTPAHKKFVESEARFSAIFGGRGSGKSAAGAQKALRKIQQGHSGAILNPDFENFKISTWPEFREWIPWGLVVPSHRYRNNPEWTPAVPFVLTFMNGVRVICKGLRDEDSARGPNMNWLWYDESGRDKTGVAWQIATASVRIGDKPQAWTTTTPKGKNWIHKFFIEQEIPEEAFELFDEAEDRPLVDFQEVSIYDNKDNLDPGFFASMLAMYPKGWLRDQEIYGKFVDERGALGDRSWFKDRILIMRPEVNIYKKVRYWDLAATEKKMGFGRKQANDPDETVGTLLSYDRDHTNYYIEHQHCGFWDWDQIKEEIRMTAMFDGPAVKVIAEQEPGSGGKNQVAALSNYIKAELPGHPGIENYRPEGDRVILANYWFSEASQGRFWIINNPARPWDVEGFLSQLDGFPEERHDDKITSVSGARINIAPIKKWVSMRFMSL